MRKSHRVFFGGHAGNRLCGILELPGQPPRAWILFSHCFTCTKDIKVIVRLSRALAERGWGVLRYDFSGLGASEGKFEDTSFTTNCRDLQLAAEFLESEYHAPRFLLGHSFGGAASLAMADALPSVVGAIPLAAPSDTHHLAELLARMNPEILTVGRGPVTIGGTTHQISKSMVEDFRSHDLRGLVSSLRKPVLVLHSPHDQTVPFEHARINAGFHETCGPPGSSKEPPLPRSLVALPHSDHLLTSSDRDITMLAGIIDAWCERWI
jgi:putative redox protein